MRNADDIGGGRNAFKYNLPQLKIKRAVKFQHRVKTVVRFRQPQVAFFDVNGFGPPFRPSLTVSGTRHNSDNRPRKNSRPRFRAGVSCGQPGRSTISLLRYALKPSTIPPPARRKAKLARRRQPSLIKTGSEKTKSCRVMDCSAFCTTAHLRCRYSFSSRCRREHPPQTLAKLQSITYSPNLPALRAYPKTLLVKI